MIDKDRPSSEWIEALHRRYPCEREVDRVLTRKLARRAGGPFTPVSRERLCDGLRSLLRAEGERSFEISGAKWLTGGASKLQMVFDLVREESTVPLVLRMEPAESVVETSRLREFQLLRAIAGRIPAPLPLWVDAEGRHLPYPALVYGWAPGVTKPSGASSGVTGTGIGFGPELRKVLGRQFVEHLATLHTLDWRRADLSAFDVPDTPTRAVEWQINWWERVWEEDCREEIPLIRAAAGWLRENMPAVDRVSLLHGDYRSGNFLFTEDDQRISAWLDWELGHLGDRHEDFGWTLARFNRQLAEDGETSLVCGLMTEEELFESYEKVSGLSLDPKRLAYYRILNAFKASLIPIASGYRVAHGGKTHQDVLLGWFVGIGYTILADLRELLEEAA